MSYAFDCAEEVFEPEGFGVMCGEDVDAVLAGDEASVRAWAIGVLNTALERVGTWPEAEELLRLAIEVLWQFSGGDAEVSEETAIMKWLDGEHPRGRQWSKFVELVPAFVGSMDTMRASRATKQELKPISDEDLPF